MGWRPGGKTGVSTSVSAPRPSAATRMQGLPLTRPQTPPTLQVTWRALFPQRMRRQQRRQVLVSCFSSSPRLATRLLCWDFCSRRRRRPASAFSWATHSGKHSANVLPGCLLSTCARWSTFLFVNLNATAQTVQWTSAFALRPSVARARLALRRFWRPWPVLSSSRLCRRGALLLASCVSCQGAELYEGCDGVFRSAVLCTAALALRGRVLHSVV